MAKFNNATYGLETQIINDLAALHLKLSKGNIKTSRTRSERSRDGENIAYYWWKHQIFENQHCPSCREMKIIKHLIFLVLGAILLSSVKGIVHNPDGSSPDDLSSVDQLQATGSWSHTISGNLVREIFTQTSEKGGTYAKEFTRDFKNTYGMKHTVRTEGTWNLCDPRKMGYSLNDKGLKGGECFEWHVKNYFGVDSLADWAGFGFVKGNLLRLYKDDYDFIDMLPRDK